MGEVKEAARRRLATAALIVLASGCRDEPAASDGDGGTMPPPSSTDEGADASTSGGVELGDDASDRCEAAPVIGAARHYGTLRGKGTELDGACGLGGPDAFLRLDVPRRSDVWVQAHGVGFEPRVGVLPDGCSADWAHRTLLCTEGIGGWLLDVAAGSSLVVSVGVAEDHPVLDEPPRLIGPDPLEFALDVELRNVLEPGETCLPQGAGRCGSGTACMTVPPPEDDPDATPGPSVCVVLPGDTCQSAEPLAIPTGMTVVELDPTTPQTDAHVQSCGGARRRERVLRLDLPGAGPHALEVRSDHPGVGLALRAPGCSPEQERACVDPDAPPAVLVAEVGGAVAFLFVELPPPADGPEDGGSSGGGTSGDPPGEEAPIVVEVARSEPELGPS